MKIQVCRSTYFKNFLTSWFQSTDTQWTRMRFLCWLIVGGEILHTYDFCIPLDFLCILKKIKKAKKIYAKESLNVHNVKILSKIFLNVFGLFIPFFWEWKLALGILSDFPGIRGLSGLNGLNSLNDLGSLNDLNSLISSKNLLNMMLPLTWQLNYQYWSLYVAWIIKNPLL